MPLYPWHGAYFTTFVIKSINMQGGFFLKRYTRYIYSILKVVRWILGTYKYAPNGCEEYLKYITLPVSGIHEKTYSGYRL